MMTDRKLSDCQIYPSKCILFKVQERESMMLTDYLDLLANVADVLGWLAVAGYVLYLIVTSWLRNRRWKRRQSEWRQDDAFYKSVRYSEKSIAVTEFDDLVAASAERVDSAPSARTNELEDLIERALSDAALVENDLPEDDPQDPRIMQIFWGTNRASDENSESRFGGERGHQLQLGVAAVRIPENHRIGRVEQPFELTILSYRLWRQNSRSDQHFVLSGIMSCSERRWRSLIERTDQTEAFVFVHGFNTSFAEALFRCAQIAWDTKVAAIPFLFSWPSRGNVLDYIYDRESAMSSRSYFLDFLAKITSDTPVKTIHILAHSMGNQVVLESLAHHPHSEEPLKISEVLMAAPDVDVDVYTKLVDRVSRAVRGMTLYASSVDRALAASRALAGNMFRAGDVSHDGPTVVEGVDSIDVTGLGADLLGLNHGVFAQARSILNDVSIVVASGHRPPHKRLADIRCVPEGSPTPRYWKYAD
jgi:esterase/lipase superfamily enzyme